ncbi:MAG: hypothetical protein FJ267_04990, partial [Planctomycetes bacterium]|nr:hypothetical protein [Planctomycetota bacterium]
MRIEHLHINRFGHFSDCDIELKGSGFHLLFGPNEAGKTTLLQFLRGLLFDFPTRTPYDFGGSGDLAGIGTMTLADGRRIELRRRKGLKNKIAFKIDDQQTDMDDAGLRRLFGHADRDLFESIFAFGLEQLSQGEASLKHDNLQSALFGGSLGGTASPDRILAELDRQSAELFKSGKATRPTINALLDELKQTQRTIKEKSLRSDEYRRREDAAAQAKETAARLQTEVEQLRLQYMSTDRLVRAWPKWWEWKQRCEERSKLPTPKKLSPNAVQRLESLLESIQTNDIERTKLVSKIELADRELAELPLDPRATSFKAEIKACLEMKQSAAEARRDLPERIRHKETKSREIDNELSELRPGWSHADLKAFSIDASTRFEIERWDDEHHDRSTERTKLTTKRDAEIENLDRFKSELANCGEAIDTAPLVAILSEETSYASCRQKREAAIAELG